MFDARFRIEIYDFKVNTWDDESRYRKSTLESAKYRAMQLATQMIRDGDTEAMLRVVDQEHKNYEVFKTHSYSI